MLFLLYFVHKPKAYGIPWESSYLPVIFGIWANPVLFTVIFNVQYKIFYGNSIIAFAIFIPWSIRCLGHPAPYMLPLAMHIGHGLYK